jgi:hypothetical protein
MSTTEIVSVKQAFAYWAVSGSTVRPLVADGRLTGHRLPSGRLGVDLAEIDAKMRPI